MKQTKKKIKLRITFTALVISGILAIVAIFFVTEVKEQLWQQSVNTIMESTRQGSNTLKVQLQDGFRSLELVKGYLSLITAGQTDKLEAAVGGYGQVDSSISLYFMDGFSFPKGHSIDEEAVKALPDIESDSGIIDPHISSVTGVNVFDLYTKVLLKDGTPGYLLKEYEIDQIVDSFSISFYNNAGFSYVMDAEGDILIRPLHPDSNKTVRNLFDMLPKGENSKESLKQFQDAIEEAKTGWAVFTYMEEPTVFCYTPLGMGSDWYLISIIPQEVVDTQTKDILIRTLILIVAILSGITFLVTMYFRYVNRTNRRLKSQADYTAHLYNAVPEGIALLTLEEPFRFLQLNREGRRLLGYPQDSPDDIPKEQMLKHVVEPEDYERLADILHATAVSGDKNSFENRVIKVDGSFFWAAGLVEKTLDENGKPILITTFHDITAEKLAEEEMQREKRQERIMLVSAISTVYPVIISLNLTKDTLKFIYVKNDLMVDMGKQKTYGGLYHEFLQNVHPDNAVEFERRFAPENILRRLGRERQEIFLEARQMLTDGHYHWIFTLIISVDNPYSDDRLAILLSRRIDEQRADEEQQRQALQSALENAKAASVAKSQFLSNISHDIRTPMNAIVGMTAIAAAHLDERDRVAECLKKINFSSQHLLSLINDILDMSKVENGKLSISEEPFDLAELVLDIVELVRVQAESGGLTLKVHKPAIRDEKVIGDPLRIRQVYLNILSNAVKYTQSGGSVSVEAWQESSRKKGYQNYVFRCTDTGIGMDQEFLQKLYQPFERAQDETARKISGTGLGMAITKNIIELIGGDIHVKSSPGEGSAFTVTLPLRLQKMQKEERAEETEALSGRSSTSIGGRVLLAEDNAMNREIARALIEDDQTVVEEAVNGAEAVQMVKDSPQGYYDLILMDIQMPVMNGYEAAEAIRKLDRKDAGTVPIVAMTANAFEEDIRTALSAGMNAHFSKPVDVKELEKLLHRYLGGDRKKHRG